jgi:hypothetical protein
MEGKQTKTVWGATMSQARRKLALDQKMITAKRATAELAMADPIHCSDRVIVVLYSGQDGPADPYRPLSGCGANMALFLPREWAVPKMKFDEVLPHACSLQVGPKMGQHFFQHGPKLVTYPVKLFMGPMCATLGPICHRRQRGANAPPSSKRNGLRVNVM